MFHSQATNLGAATRGSVGFQSFLRNLADERRPRRWRGGAAELAVAGDQRATATHVAFFTALGARAERHRRPADIYLHRYVPGAGRAADADAHAEPDRRARRGTAPPAVPAAVTLRGEAAFARGTANDLYLACTTLDLYLVDVLPRAAASR